MNVSFAIINSNIIFSFLEDGMGGPSSGSVHKNIRATMHCFLFTGRAKLLNSSKPHRSTES